MLQAYTPVMDTAGKHNGNRPKMTRRRFIKLTATMLVAGVAIDALLIEPRTVSVTKHEVHLARLPRELDGLRIVQLSDLHRSRIVPDSVIRSAVTVANSLRPDIAVFTGDFVNRNAANAKPCAQMLSRLKSKYGSYAVLGNHDHWTDGKEVTRQLEAHGIKVMVNENTELAPGLVFLGLDDWWAGKPDTEKTWQGANPDAAHVFLCHNPLAVDSVRERECLMISGHTHGGQVHIPFVPRNKLRGLKGWKYIRGWYHEGKVQMYINRGIGMINPPARFFCRPEVTLFVLRSKL